jgi:hypothetical protein
MLACRKDSAVKGIKFYWCNREVSNEKVKVYFDKFESYYKLEIAKLEEKIADLEVDNKTLKAINILSENSIKNANDKIGSLLDDRV